MTLVTMVPGIATTLNVLEARRRIGPDSRSFNAASSECLGDTPGAADENTPLRSVLSWTAETRGEALVDRLVQAELSGAAY